MIQIHLSTGGDSALDATPYVQTAIARFTALGVAVHHSSSRTFQEFRGGEPLGYTICAELEVADGNSTNVTEALSRVEAALKALAKDANKSIKFRLLVERLHQDADDAFAHSQAAPANS